MYGIKLTRRRRRRRGPSRRRLSQVTSIALELSDDHPLARALRGEATHGTEERPPATDLWPSLVLGLAWRLLAILQERIRKSSENRQKTNRPGRIL